MRLSLQIQENLEPIRQLIEYRQKPGGESVAVNSILSAIYLNYRTDKFLYNQLFTNISVRCSVPVAGAYRRAPMDYHQTARSRSNAD